MQNIQVKETKGEALDIGKNPSMKKTLSDKEIEKTNNNNIGFVNLANSTKNTSKKTINFNFQTTKYTNNESSNLNNKKFYIKLPDKDKLIIDSDRSPKNREFSQTKGDIKFIPKIKETKVPLTNNSLNKVKVDIKLPNSTRANENKLIIEPNLFSNSIKKDISGSSKGLKKVSKK